MRRILRRYYFVLNEVGRTELLRRLHNATWSAVAASEPLARLKVCIEHGECHNDYQDGSVAEAYLQMFHLEVSDGIVNRKPVCG
jgi:hypothetical protein